MVTFAAAELRVAATEVSDRLGRGGAEGYTTLPMGEGHPLRSDFVRGHVVGKGNFGRRQRVEDEVMQGVEESPMLRRHVRDPGGDVVGDGVFSHE
jgi:hypothetical protein